ncbi:hypothetical protein ABEF92_003746 [Exophiala dermatitidis]|uniref:Monopolin complex subunit Csm1/Pcs1 C-terminal domain-containing protein n=1 Tax=Exophiala dermatitidis (strain ATCC 34100 / CBS 525.76 / NIH/UT8656) TaxID=858893 RepID=H6C5P3_EXODN|nr:uncharacterized protein HMPREF1120_07039 [Exophiala dermatitidis NIH/UT8656]KAJ4523168.1 hypothetical protein HRR75_001567 [Exophiala dermatitidis]EHY59039.1 hypothetical protein HMPREF1120_07039 [Exophiala dermatitidis NIH/UT8656]KAJ4532257.1 hypothetical protein HRR76_007255 [Exophiala dermatitidis]KAJ4546293.1 hypothetical protein HRR77_004828 [Exophiala dermatitidis]KAJ4560136.1 hypothetical protein HRR78_000661 [Exophiala dermatitidis]
MRGIADLVESAMEDSTTNFIDENSILSSASDASAAASAAQAQPAQAKRGKKRHRVTMPTKTRSKVQKVAPAPAPTTGAKKAAATKRTTTAKRKAQALEEHIEETETADNGNDDHNDVEVTQEVVEPKRKKVARTKQSKANATKKAAVEANNEPTEDGMDVEASPVANVRPNNRTNTKDAAPKIAKKSSKATTTSKKASSAQQQQQQLKATVEAEEEQQSDAVDEMEEEEEGPRPAVVTTAAAAKPIPRQNRATGTTRDTSRARHEPTTIGYAAQRRAGSASDTDNRGGDPSLRRKLGDITRKFENVDLKYRNLKEVGIHEASTNMEKLRKQCDAAMAASNDLIASLKKELAAQAPLAQEARKLKKQMQTQEQEMVTMRKALSDLENSLSAAQNENKALQAKLAAARAPSVDNNNNARGAKTPGSAMKAVVAQRPAMIGSAEAAQAAQIAQMKEDLYSDLTGLIIRSVKRTDEGDTYDCIQTGRNGTLHFKLYVDQEDARTASFEETEFLYTPLLDANRDRDMIELMPTYLTEDITFARQNAAKFYGRVVDTLTKRRAEE